MARHASDLDLRVQRLTQPDDVTCGPTCLSSVLRFLGHPEATLDEVIARTPRNADGGTLGPHLGRAALRFGMQARVWSFAVQVFDPSWRRLSRPELLDRLRRRIDHLPEGRLRRTHLAYLEFLEEGGEVRLTELRRRDLVAALNRGHPLIVGLSVTWLYQHPREMPEDNQPDDIRGSPVGHFVVVTGYLARGKRFLVSDPWPSPPFEGDRHYPVSDRRLLQAILLGDVTNDAVVVEIQPPEAKRP